MSRQNVLLINTNRMRPPIAPLALDYIGAAVRPAGHQVRIVDLCRATDVVGALKGAFADRRPDLVAMTFRNTDDCYFASRQSFVGLLAADVDHVRQCYDGPIVVGGGGFSIMPVAILERVGADYGVRGDGEVALPQLLAMVAAKRSVSAVPGLIYRRDGTWHENGLALADLGACDLSCRDVVDNDWYFRNGGQAGLETKRGCPGTCVYCADPVIKGRRSRLRAPAEVVREVRNLLAQGIDCVHTCDSEFNVPVDHAEAVCEALISARLGDRMRWYAYAAPAPFTARLAGLMKKAGCAGINFGVDSGCPAMLAALGRGFDTACLEVAARLCRQHRITAMYDLLLGGPGETCETLTKTVQLMRRIGPDRVGVSLGVRVYPGTPLADRFAEQGRESLVGDPTGLEPLFFVSPALGEDPAALVRDLIGADERFFIPGSNTAADYNYNDNRLLEQAIADGHRGAYWDILRRLQQSAPPRAVEDPT